MTTYWSKSNPSGAASLKKSDTLSQWPSADKNSPTRGGTLWSSSFSILGFSGFCLHSSFACSSRSYGQLLCCSHKTLLGYSHPLPLTLTTFLSPLWRCSCSFGDSSMIQKSHLVLRFYSLLIDCSCINVLMSSPARRSVFDEYWNMH